MVKDPKLRTFSLLGRQRCENLAGIPEPKFGVEMFSFTYFTEDYRGKTVLASASLSLPLEKKRGENISLVSYHHGTVTKRDSVSSVQGLETENEAFVSKLFCSQGFACLIPDYLGFGVSKILHPYLHRESLATSIRDALIAADELSRELERNLSGEFFLTGYSEGGQATLAAQQLLETQAIEGLELKASAPLGGPYDLSQTMLSIMLNREPYPAPAYAPYILLAYNEIYGFQSSLKNFFRNPFDTILPELFNGENGRSEIEEHLPEFPIEILREEIIDDLIQNEQNPIRLAIAQNDTYRFIPKSSIKLFHGKRDKTVPIANALVAQNYFKKMGRNDIELISIDVDGHSEAAVPCILGALDYFKSERSA